MMLVGLSIPRAVLSFAVPLGPAEPLHVTRDRIIRQVAELHCLKVADLTGPERTKLIAHARHEAMWRLSLETPMSLNQIGKRLGNRDHTTVLYGVRAHQRRLDEQGREGT